MTARLHTLVVCALLCTVLAAPAVGGSATTPAAYTQVEDPSEEPDPEIFVNTTTVDFGEVDVGETATATITVRNDGEGTLRVKDLVLGGDDAFSLALDDSSSSGTEGEVATSPNFTLEPGESEQISVVFEPSTGGSVDGTLTIDSDDPDASTVDVDLGGDGRQPNPPAIALDTQSLTFDDAAVGEQSVRNVTVSNTGDGDLAIGSQTIQSGGSDFEILTPLGGPIPPGESETLSVGFEPTTRNATAATLSLATNAPSSPTLVYLSSSRATADVSLNRTANTTEVTASVRNATAGEAVSISVPSDPDDPASTDVDSVSVTPARNGSFDLDVSSSEEPPADASTFEAPDSTEPEGLGYLNVTHSIPNENISQATIQYRVNQSQMDELEAEPEDFSLYRRVNDTWERVNTTFEREQNGTFVFSGTASGLSEWTAATEVPRISVSDASANVTAVTLEESVEIRVLLNNTGGSDGRFEVELLQNGTVVERRDVAVSPQTTSLVTFQRGFDQTGTYGIEVNDVFVAAIDVSEGEASVVEGGEATVDAAETTESAGGPGPILLGGVVAVLGVVALAGFGAYRVVGSGDEQSGADAPPTASTDERGGSVDGAEPASGAATGVGDADDPSDDDAGGESDDGTGTGDESGDDAGADGDEGAADADDAPATDDEDDRPA